MYFNGKKLPLAFMKVAPDSEIVHLENPVSSSGKELAFTIETTKTPIAVSLASLDGGFGAGIWLNLYVNFEKDTITGVKLDNHWDIQVDTAPAIEWTLTQFSESVLIVIRITAGASEVFNSGNYAATILT